MGKEYADQIETLSIQIYETANAYAATRGIVIADTKFEFGLDSSTTPPSVVLIDEILTPDSSRFWSLDKYEVGRSQISYDKQDLRGQSPTVPNLVGNNYNLANSLDRLASTEWTKREGRCQDAR